MLLTDEELAQGLQAAGLPAETSRRAETRGAGAPDVEGAVATPTWHVEDEVGLDEPEDQPGAEDVLQHLGDVLDDDQLIVQLPEEERSAGWHSPEPTLPEAPYQGRPQ